MAGELELARRIRDEAYHLRVITRELRNRAKTLATVIDESCNRLDGIVDELETETLTPGGPRDEQGTDSPRARELEHATH